MTVKRACADTIELSGDCSQEDAEPLLQLLLATPQATVDWRQCRAAHAAVVQVLLAAGCALCGPPADARLGECLAAALAPPAAAPGGPS